jgi:hypothetical protein
MYPADNLQQATVNTLRGLQSATPFTLRVPSAGAHKAGEELGALIFQASQPDTS